MTNPLILVDWGSSNFRAFLIDGESGQCLDRRASERGLKSLRSDQFAEYCAAELTDWRQADALPVYMAGMVGSARGWMETPQLDLPLDSAGLAAGVRAVPDFDNGWILPGARVLGEHEVDVMRGEEVQALGALAIAGLGDAMLCLPGTHSKWVRAGGGRLLDFTTLMTGELYQAVRFHTLIGEPARDESTFEPEAFALGLDRVHESPGGVLHALFEGRSRMLQAGLAAPAVASYLSGVLIGEEIRCMRQAHPALEALLLVGAERLRAPYSQALHYAGLEPRWIDSDRASLAGMLEVARRHREMIRCL
ncbi:2-dehydro-3-deoxygalactonokinase [Marinobacterium aestuariivivens]|uniref:2-dehydro-3-deoxygalactonokinase n=1 Tax=Marinobacterium aestuariivivens TaxID=1698799 RepID=A0ABW1ZWG9_9GAMM